ncbi:MAG: APC family permease [Blastocatellia bacterium]|nr:APC family permease [Blastocatellia bacterium]
MKESSPGLKRALKLRDLILLNIVAVYTPGTISQTMPLGKTGLLIWAGGVLFFMLPYAAAIADLSVRFPREGGVYAWTRMAFGDFHGFVCGWCYWVNTFLYVPSVFLSIVAVAALLGGDRTAWLNDNPVAVTAIAGGALWVSAMLHIVGLGQGKWIQNLGAIGRLGIAVAILGATAWKLWMGEGAAAAAATNTLGPLQMLALWPFVLNALVGLDLGSAMSEEADDAGRDIPRSLLVGGLAVAGCFLLTYCATLFIGVNDPNPIYGHLQAVNAVVSRTAMPALAALIIATELLGLLGSGAAWLAAPARVPFAIGIDHYLPAAFARVHPRFGTPYVALIAQAVVATFLIFVNTWGATLQEAYLALLGGSIVLVMVTYAYLLAAWGRLQPRASASGRALRAFGLLAVSTATIACFLPPPAVRDLAGFELKLIGAVAVMLLCGLSLYALGRKSRPTSAGSIKIGDFRGRF